MKRSITLTVAAALSTLLCCTAALAVQDCDIKGQPVNPANGSTTAGKSGIMRCIDRDTGVIQREQELRDGKFVGLVRFYQDGQLAKEHMVNERGNLQGRAREYAANGKTIRDAVYENGSVTGLSRSFYPSGQVRRATFYGDRNAELAYAELNERGQLTGLRCGNKAMLAPAFDESVPCGFSGKVVAAEFFSSTGTVVARSSYIAGKRLRHERLHANGQIAELEEITDEMRTERRFGSDGVKRKETIWIVGDKATFKRREQDFSERGTLTRDQQWRDGTPVSDLEYFLNGQLRRKTEFSGDRTGKDARSSRVSDYFDNGKLAGERSYLLPSRGPQVATGIHKRYDEKGQVRSESTYDDKGEIRRERVWNENGQLARDDEVFADGSRKSFSR